ncbi:MAG: hypothetical protein JXQ76_08775 [Campylobacterales bacterium]|nr:hypothetical protein [Campylobacterales bacterium]
MKFKNMFFASFAIIPSLLISSVELNKNNSCKSPYTIPQLSGISDDVNYSDDYSNKHSKDIYLSFKTSIDGNFSLELLKDNTKKMKYQLFIGNSCDALNLIEEPSFEYTHNVNLAIQANQNYIIKVVKHSNGNSRYTIAYTFIAKDEEIIHGHTLPPEPDPTINNATLGGVDSNGNGVRDDVERAIYKKYDKKLHVIYLLDKAKFCQRTLVEPTSNAQEIVKYSIKTGNCQLYLINLNGSSLTGDKVIKNSDYIRNLSFNNPERVKKYLDYNQALSGGVYGSNIRDWNRQACSEEVVKVLEEMGL